MNITVKYFGIIAEKTKINDEVFEAPTDTDIDSCLIILKEKYPELNNLSFKVALNQAIKNKNVPLQANDELALLPPFSGG